MEEGLMHFRLAGVPQGHLTLEAMRKQLAELTHSLPMRHCAQMQPILLHRHVWSERWLLRRLWQSMLSTFWHKR
eukprot:1144072-Pelagomonas_calceolata.AAC.3